jgi:hypothetical protein
MERDFVRLAPLSAGCTLREPHAIPEESRFSFTPIRVMKNPVEGRISHNYTSPPPDASLRSSMTKSDFLHFVVITAKAGIRRGGKGEELVGCASLDPPYDTYYS